MEKIFIRHYGVLGQRWGIRKSVNQQKDDINSKDRFIKKGTEIQNLSTGNLDFNKSDRIYGAYTSFDKAMYNDLMPFTYLDKDVHQNQFLVKKDIKIASDKKVIEIFLKTLKENPDRVSQDLSFAIKARSFFPKNQELLKKEIKSLDLNNTEDKKVKKFTNDFLVKAMVTGESRMSTNIFFNNLLKEGYDGISDVNDRKGYAKDPLIIFNKSRLKQISNIALSKEDIENYAKSYSLIENSSQRKDLSDVYHTVLYEGIKT